MSEEDAAREGSYPFTTITPNVGRGFIALPDPSPLLGLNPGEVQPAYGFAPGLDIARLQQAGFSSTAPLQQLVKDCGWQQPGAGSDGSGGDGVLWRRVPVVVKDVAGLVPGARVLAKCLMLCAEGGVYAALSAVCCSAPGVQLPPNTTYS